jgi:hypothetical protein
MPLFEIGVRIVVSARTKEEAERLLDTKLVRMESDVIVRTERFETKGL